MDKIPETLVVDACILFSFFSKGTDRRMLIEELPLRGCRLLSPDHAFREISQKAEKIKKYGKINDLGFAFLFSLMEKKIESSPYESYACFLAQANKISPHGTGNKDDPYYALALSLNAPIWSDEKEFKEQTKVTVYNTHELCEMLGRA